MHVKYVIFDFDGVIADTEERNKEYMAKALSAFGLTMTQEEKKLLIGRSDNVVLKDILKRGAEPVSMERFLQKRKEVGNSYEDGTIEPMPGLFGFLDRLKARKVRLAIGSSTSSRLILAALDHMSLLSYFDVIVCGDMCENSKPHPEIYQKVMWYLHARPEECVVVEDSSAGVQAGLCAGAKVLVYCGAAYVKEGELQQDVSGAQLCLDRLEDAGEEFLERLLA
jgi:beta-phosphoglucomutase